MSEVVVHTIRFGFTFHNIYMIKQHHLHTNLNVISIYLENAAHTN